MKRYLFAILLTMGALSSGAKTTDLSKKETANCYMVKPCTAAGYESRADVKGNGIGLGSHYFNSSAMSIRPQKTSSQSY